MTRDRWESILFAHVKDEVVQDMLNEYVLELESENAKLRKELEEVGTPSYVYRIESRWAKLADERCAENARLRDLISQIWPVVEHPARWCESCPYADGCMEHYYSGGFVRNGCQWREDMRGLARELEVEVDR